MKLLGLILVAVLFELLYLIITSIAVYGVCWAFGLTFTWKIAIGIWIGLGLLKSIFKANK